MKRPPFLLPSTGSSSLEHGSWFLAFPALFRFFLNAYPAQLEMHRSVGVHETHVTICRSRNLFKGFRTHSTGLNRNSLEKGVKGHSYASKRCRSADQESQPSTVPAEVEDLDVDAARRELSQGPIGIQIRETIVSETPEASGTTVRLISGLSAASEESLVKKVEALLVLLSPFFFWGTSMVAMKVRR